MLSRRATFIIVICIYVFVLSLHVITDPDYWTHLAEGESIATALTGPAPFDTLYNLFLGGSNEQSFQLLLHLLYVLGSHEMISLFVAVIAGLILLPLLLLIPASLTQNRYWLLFILCSGIAITAAFRFSPRPELLSYLLFTILLMLLYRWVERPHGKGITMACLVLLVWMSLHVSWTIGFFYALVILAMRPRLDFWRNLLTPLPLFVRATAVITIAAGIGYGLFRMAGFVTFVFQNLNNQGILFGVSEMQPLWVFPDIFASFVITSLFSLVLTIGDRKERINRMVLWACSFMLGLVVTRNVAFGLLAQIPGALIGLSRKPVPSIDSKTGRVLPFVASAIVLILLALSLGFKGPPPGVGVAWRMYPKDAAIFVKEQRLPREVFNNWDWGGYLRWIWKEQPRPFLDGRLGQKQKLDEHDRVLEANNAEWVLDQYDINTIILQGMYDNSGRIYPIIAWLLSNQEWKLMRATDALVFVRGRAFPLAGLQPQEAWWFIARQAELRIASHDPARHLSYSRSVAYANLMRFDTARIALQHAVRAHPEIASRYAYLLTMLNVAVH